MNCEWLWTNNAAPCAECGSPTHLVEICAEAHLCSQPCAELFELGYWKATLGGSEEETDVRR